MGNCFRTIFLYISQCDDSGRKLKGCEGDWETAAQKKKTIRMEVYEWETLTELKKKKKKKMTNSEKEKRKKI